MANKVEKKILYFRSFPYIDLRLKDLANAENKSESNVAEELILGQRNGLLPQNRTAAKLLLDCYSSENAPIELLSGAAQILYRHAIQGNVYDNSIDFVQYIHSCLLTEGTAAQSVTNESLTENFAVQMDLLLDQLALIGEFSLENASAQRMLQSNVALGNALVENLRKNPSAVLGLDSFTYLLLEEWALLKDNVTTYRAIDCMLRLFSVENSIDRRNEIADLICNLSKAWPQ